MGCLMSLITLPLQIVNLLFRTLYWCFKIPWEILEHLSRHSRRRRVRITATTTPRRAPRKTTPRRNSQRMNMITTGPALNIRSGADAKRKGIVGAQWVASDDSCPLCKALDGMTVSVDHPDFNRFVPRLHDGCKCVRLYIGAGQSHVEFNWQTPPADLIAQHAPHLI
ncbi:hypothetical protein [Alicyclobacillus macrosporangiidus]|uniref:hypothetical protein n=1 Tax=Alicyclobacillus macrosporangiidus TaxID=392015 RepID=UPI0004976756|nr:hypothetical protein [Alicyclobacillus macrosporangiidus]